MRKIILATPIFILIAIFIYSSSLAQRTQVDWDYPMKPGSSGWSNLKTEKDRFESMQIPEDILREISTEKLVVLCLNFPAFGYIGAYEDLQTGFIILATKFNGLSELAERKNVLPILSDFYKSTGEHGYITNQHNLEDNYWTMRFDWIEMLLSQRKFLNAAGKLDKRELMQVSIEKYNMKMESPDFSSSSTCSTLFLMANILESENDPGFIAERNTNNDLTQFVSTSKIRNANIAPTILELSLNYLNN